MIRSRKKQKKKGSGPFPLIIITLVVGLFATLFYQYFELTQNEIKLDSNNCRVDGLFPRDTVILLDATDALSDSQLVGVGNRMELIVREGIMHERFTIYALEDDPDRFKSSRTLCNKGDGQQKPWLLRAKKTLRDWRVEFRDPMLNSVKGLASVTPSTSSPIMEMIKFVGLRTFALSKSSDKRLILVSDMVEHTDSYSQYRDRKLDFENLSKSPYFREMRPRLNDVMIDLLYIERPALSDIQGSDHVTKFWRPFVRRSGGKIKSVTYIN
jgi:hypothetical protein